MMGDYQVRSDSYRNRERLEGKFLQPTRLPSSARTTSQSAPKVYASKHRLTYYILWHLDCSCCLDKVNRAAGRRTVVMVFAPDSYREPSGQFYLDMTTPSHLSGLSHLDNFTGRRNFSPFIGTMQKQLLFNILCTRF